MSLIYIVLMFSLVCLLISYNRDKKNNQIPQSKYLFSENLIYSYRNSNIKKDKMNKIYCLPKTIFLPSVEKNENKETPKKEKEYARPNLDFLANDWIDENLSLINTMFANTYSSSNDSTSITIPKNKLPSYLEAWDIIGKKLMEQEEIEFYEIKENGLEIKV